MGKTNTESESRKQKLITEFTPFTGLRLRVPLQWVPIQLISLSWYKMVLESTSATVTERCTKSLRPLFWKLQLAFERQRKLNYNRECQLQKETASGHFTATPQVSHNRKTKLCALTQSESPLFCPLMWPEVPLFNVFAK